MKKKLVYAGLAMIAVAIVLFLSAGYVGYSLNGAAGALPAVSVNKTIASNSFAYVAINTSDAQTVVVSAALNAPANIYMFNAADFHSWEGLEASGGGLAAAQAENPEGNFIYEGTQLIMPMNASKVFLPNDTYNNTLYVVVDNTQGSASSNTSIDARVVYLALNANLLAQYRSKLGVPYELVAAMSIIAIVLLIGGIAVVIFGAMKKDVQQEPSPFARKDDGESSESYIDALYKDVSKPTRRGRGSRKGKK